MKDKTYRKTATIQAMQFFPEQDQVPEGVVQREASPTGWAVRTIEGWAKIRSGDYRAIGIAGERYVIEREIFEDTYEEVAA